MRSNCVLWAIALYRRRKAKGREGYIMIRASRLAWGPHMLYAEVRRTGTMRVVSYKPAHAKVKRVVPPLFKGSSRWGDFADTEVV